MTSETPGSAQPEIENLAAALYPELRRIAHGIRGRLGANETLRTTALVNEAFLKLANSERWNDQQHFLAASAMAMRQIVVDDTRARLAQRRGKGVKPASIHDTGVLNAAVDETDDLRDVAVGDALEQLRALNPRLAQVVECRYFAGFTVADTARALNLNERTVHRDWLKARGWLYQELKADLGLQD